MALWIFAVVLTLGLGGITVAVWPQVIGGSPAGRLGLAAAWLVPAFAIALAALQTVVVRRLAGSTFELDGPAALGGVLSGVLHVPGFVRRAHGLEVMLECRKRVSVRSGLSPRVHSVAVQWRDGATLDPAGLARSPRGAAIPVVFDLPGPGSGAEASGDPAGAVSWALLLLADLPRVDGIVELPLDVRPSAAGPAPAGERRQMPRLQRPSRPASSSIRARAVPGGTAYLLPTVPWFLWVVPLLLAAAILWFRHAPFFAGNDPLPWALGVAGGFEAILAIVAISSTSRLELFPDELRVRTGVRFAGWWQRIPRADVLEVRTRAGTANIVKYSVLVRTKEGDRVVASNLERLGDAEWLAAELDRWRVP
ncbi:MAG: hypothetical protein U0529_08750 [Thermoanaerobaculia bacterium]